MIYIKQAQTPAVSRHITDPAIRDYFQHEGHRTVISQRALQAHADPWLGWTELDGAGQLVAEVSPYAVDLDWSRHRRPGGDRGGRRRPRPGHGHDARGGGRRERPLAWCRSPPSGPSTRRSRPTRTASPSCWSTSRTSYGARARARPPDLRGPVPQRPDPGPVTAGAAGRPDRGPTHRDPLGVPYRCAWHTLLRDGHIRDPAQSRARGAVHGARRDALRRVARAAVPGPAAADHGGRDRRSPSSPSRTRWPAASAASGGSPPC